MFPAEPSDTPHARPTSRALPYRAFESEGYRALDRRRRPFTPAKPGASISGAQLLGVVEGAARSKRQGVLRTRKGPLAVPAFLPVVTAGGYRELDELLRPYLASICPAVLISEYYARFLPAPLPVITALDSGGFVGLSRGIRLEHEGSCTMLVTRTGRAIHPRVILELGEKLAEIVFTLDVAIPVGADARECERRFAFSLENARWMLNQRQNRDVLLFAALPACDDVARTARWAARFADLGADGLALGGLTARRATPSLVEELVPATLDHAKGLPLHAFGLGEPALLCRLFDAGLATADSSRPWRAVIADVLADDPQAPPLALLAEAVKRFRNEETVSP